MSLLLAVAQQNAQKSGPSAEEIRSTELIYDLLTIYTFSLQLLPPTDAKRVHKTCETWRPMQSGDHPIIAGTTWHREEQLVGII
jgi:hypothetical protein